MPLNHELHIAFVPFYSICLRFECCASSSGRRSSPFWSDRREWIDSRLRRGSRRTGRRCPPRTEIDTSGSSCPCADCWSNRQSVVFVVCFCSSNCLYSIEEYLIECIACKAFAYLSNAIALGELLIRQVLVLLGQIVGSPAACVVVHKRQSEYANSYLATARIGLFARIDHLFSLGHIRYASFPCFCFCLFLFFCFLLNNLLSFKTKLYK